MDFQTITYQKSQGFGFVSLNRPDHANALNLQMIDELTTVIKKGESELICAWVLQHTGKFFSAGLELEKFENLSVDDLDPLMTKFANLIQTIQSSPIPVIAAIDGKVMGGGAGLVAACDLVLISKNASLSLPEVLSGMIPALILPVLMQRIPLGKLRALAVGTFEVKGEELLQLGFADRLGESIEHLLKDQLKRIVRSQPDAITMIKKLLSDLNKSDVKEIHETAYNALQDWLKRDQQLEIIKAITTGDSPFWNSEMGKNRGSDD